MGRAYRYQRRLSHISISVAERDGGESLVHTVGETSEAETAPKTAKKKRPAKKAPVRKLSGRADGKKAAPKKAGKTWKGLGKKG
jgi:large subunit ribosomal protein L22